MPKALSQRLWNTAVVLGVYAACWLLPSPLLDGGLMEELASGGDESPLLFAAARGPFNVGLGPILLAFVIVELFAMGVPSLDRLRHGDAETRAKLTRASIYLALVLGAFHGLAEAAWVEHIAVINADSALVLVANPGWGFRLQVILLAVTATGITLLLAEGISRRGIGNGLLLLLLLDFMLEIAIEGWTLWSLFQTSGRPMMKLVAWLAVVLGLLVLFGHQLARRPHRAGGVPIVGLTCGIVPLIILGFVFAAPIELITRIVNQSAAARISEVVFPDPLTLPWGQMGVVLLLAPLLSFLFYHRFAPRLQEQREGAMTWLRQRVATVGILLLILMSWHYLHRALRKDVVPAFNLVQLLFVTAIISDLAVEIRGRWRAPDAADLIPISSHQHPVDAVLELEQREAEDSGTVVLQGLHFRSLMHIFAPYAPVKVLAPAPDPADDEEDEDREGEGDSLGELAEC